MSRAPVLIELDPSGPRPGPAEAPPVPDPEAPLPEGQAVQAAALLAASRPSALGRLALWAMGALLGLVISVALHDFVAQMLARNSLLGGLTLGLAGVTVLALLALSIREAAGFWRLARLDDLRHQTATARASADLAAARKSARQIEALYANRPELRWPLARLKDRQAEILDADALLNFTEAELMAPLDEASRRRIEAASRRVATVTALVPLALADVAVALFANLAMIRAIATIYGGRSGTLGSLKLLRRVFSHLLATGALAIGDDLIGSVAGGGILGKLSRRFGEGVVNGALTARVGIAAMEVCRPMPFAALPRPKVSNLMSRALAGVFDGLGARPPSP